MGGMSYEGVEVEVGIISKFTLVVMVCIGEERPRNNSST